MNETATHLKNDIETLIAELNTAHAAFLNGQEDALDGLDDRVEEICATIEDADTETKVICEEPMAELIIVLEKLAVTLKDVVDEDDDA